RDGARGNRALVRPRPGDATGDAAARGPRDDAESQPLAAHAAGELLCPRQRCGEHAQQRGARRNRDGGVARMTKVLVVGATGQLRARIVNRMSRRSDRAVRALVRPSSTAGDLFDSEVEICAGDLRDKPSLMRACEGVDVVVATATVVFPKGRYSFHHDE